MYSYYLGKVYDDWKVVDRIKIKKYSMYEGEKFKQGHNCYSFVLENQKTGLRLTLSNDRLRRVKKGERTINQMLFEKKRGGYKNSQIKQIKSELSNNLFTKEAI